MAEDKDREGISAATFFGTVGQIYLCLALVLLVSSRPEEHWSRVAIQWLLILLMVLYTGLALWLRVRKKAPKPPHA